ncbi:hypothetical protein [Kitasatospora sp. NPDC050463]|uniref:hypothetical protein n=1 Tax=Kitasatospora sp. NPDC050463 TaxID=3155786 RepID=UPI0033D54DF0
MGPAEPPEDAQETAEPLTPGTVALPMLIEHVWAQEAAGAPRAVGGRIAPGVRIPQLSDLGRPAQQGLLTPGEFATAKARPLGG